MTELEVWEAVPRYEDLYLISNYGRVKALPKMVINSLGRMYKYEEKILKPNFSNGYRTVSLVRNKEKITNKIHWLVGQQFVPNPNQKPFIIHLDGDRSNNFYKNLEWSTNSEKQLHAYNVLGIVAVRGIQNGQCKLTEDDVKLIRRLKESGRTLKSIALDFKMSKEAVRKIVIGKTWGWLKD